MGSFFYPPPQTGRETSLRHTAKRMKNRNREKRETAFSTQHGRAGAASVCDTRAPEVRAPDRNMGGKCATGVEKFFFPNMLSKVRN